MLLGSYFIIWSKMYISYHFMSAIGSDQKWTKAIFLGSKSWRNWKKMLTFPFSNNLKIYIIISYYSSYFNDYAWDFWKLIKFRFSKPKYYLISFPQSPYKFIDAFVQSQNIEALCNKIMKFCRSLHFSSYNLQLEWMLTKSNI